MPRWMDIEDRWRERLELIADLIPQGSSVLDLGCGAQGLRQLVDGPYTPADIHPRTPDTLPFDMHREVYPQGQWDIAVLSGVLEYASHPLRVLRRVRPLAPKAILTYQTVSRPTHERSAADFRNHLSHLGLLRLCRRAGYDAELVGRWNRQSLYRLT